MVQRVLSVVVLSLCAISFVSAAEAPHYKLKQGDQLVYDMQLEIGRGGALESRSVRTTFTVLSASEHGIAISGKGKVTTKNQWGIFDSSAVVFDDVSFFDTAPKWASEVRFDQLGRLSGAAQATRITPRVGDWLRMIIHPLPEGNERQWQTEESVGVSFDTTTLTYWGLRYHFSVKTISLDATEKTTYTLGKQIGNTLAINRKYELRSNHKPGDPAMVVIGQGQMIFDLAAGAPQEMELGGTVNLRYDDKSTVTIPFRESYRRVPPEEVARQAAALKLEQEIRTALNGLTYELTRSQALKPIPMDQQIDAALEELKTQDEVAQINGLGMLASTQPDLNRRTQVVAAVRTVQSASTNTAVKDAIVRLLDYWQRTTPLTAQDIAEPDQPITQKQIDLLLRDAGSSNPRIYGACITALGRAYGSEQVARALAAYLTDPFKRTAAKTSLLKLGPVAADAVRKLASSDDVFVRREAEEVLKATASTEEQLAMAEAAQAEKDRESRIRSVGRQVNKLLGTSAALREPLSVSELNEALNKLKSKDMEQVVEGVLALAGARPDRSKRMVVVRAIDAMKARIDEFFVESAADDVRKEWLNAAEMAADDKQSGSEWSSAQIQQFLRDINSSDFRKRDSAFESLAVVNDNPRVAKAVAACLSDSFKRRKAAECLKQMGSIAAPEVVRYISSSDHFLRKEALGILHEIGTMKEIPALERLLSTASRDVFLKDDVESVIAAIRLREE